MKKQERADIISAYKKMRAFVKSKRFGAFHWQRNGLCHILDELYFSGSISYSAEEYIRDVIRKLRSKANTAYLWSPGVRAPRVKWINEQIKKLEKK